MMTMKELITALLDANMDSLVIVEDEEPYSFQLQIEEDVFIKPLKEE